VPCKKLNFLLGKKLQNFTDEVRKSEKLMAGQPITLHSWGF